MKYNKPNILIDAIYINNSGGKVLLDYLIKCLEKTDGNFIYLFDKRIINNHPSIKSSNQIIYLKASFYLRYKFYRKNRNSFTRVLCFGNLPPNIELSAEVYTYFHQPMFLNIPKEFSIIEQIKFHIKISILKLIAKKTNYWIVQSNFVKDELIKKYKIKHTKIKILPFYPQFEDTIATIKEKYTYFYVSNASPHKNHKKLIEVFCRFYDKHKLGTLILTINDDNKSILELIKLKIKLKYPIKNIGFIGREELKKYYLNSEFLVFPSLTESFGLGLIEAIESGCKIIGADLPYTYEVCEPSIVFNPIDDESFLDAFEFSLKENVKESIPKIKNNINELINILQNNSCN